MEIQQVLPMAINVGSILKSMSAIIKELRRANSWPLTCSARGHQYHAPVLEELRKNLLHSCPILSNFDHISLFLMVRQDKTTGWWFGTMVFMTFHINWECHHPNWLSLHHFQRGGDTNHQPDKCKTMVPWCSLSRFVSSQWIHQIHAFEPPAVVHWNGDFFGNALVLVPHALFCF